jgi:hypothetical protein
MDGQPDLVSFGPRRRRGWRPRSRAQLAMILVLLSCLGIITWLALLVVHRDDTVASLRAALRDTRPPAPPAAAELSGSAMFTLPGAARGSFSMIAVVIRTGSDASPLTWLFVYGQHADPGQRYGVIEGTCGGQYVASSALSDGVADKNGNLTITVPDLGLGPLAPDDWFMLYRWQDGAPLGGVQGPLTGGGARTFRFAPSCSSSAG